MATWYIIGTQKVRDMTPPPSPTRDYRPISSDVVFHISIPVGNNSAGRSWRNCVLDDVDAADDGVESPIRAMGTRFPTEWGKLQSGEYYSKSETVRFSSAYLTPAQRNAEIQARAEEIEATILNELQVAYEWMGYNNTIA